MTKKQFEIEGPYTADDVNDLRTPFAQAMGAVGQGLLLFAAFAAGFLVCASRYACAG